MNERHAYDRTPTNVSPVAHTRRRSDAADRIFFLLVLAMLPMLWLEYVTGVAAFWRELFHWYFLAIWALFALEFLVRFLRSDNRRVYFRRNWIEAVIVFFPFLRILQLFRPVELAFVLIADRFARATPLFRINRFFQIVVVLVIVSAVSSELILLFEKGYPESGIRTFGDALWWSTLGISTIGLGNVVPISAAGRALTLVLAVVGIFIFSVLTAQFADLFITEERIQEALEKGGRSGADQKMVLEKLDRIEERLAHMEQDGGTRDDGSQRTGHP
ncbi:MAG: two pore domain potassium channel family protein [Candidatus Terrybacteria bacterium]|nr:two pore domain potassium channel family protein [Candidatus Terrybacteria bacterium]